MPSRFLTTYYFKQNERQLPEWQLATGTDENASALTTTQLTQNYELTRTTFWRPLNTTEKSAARLPRELVSYTSCEVGMHDPGGRDEHVSD
jgi:hypothetical protein